MHHFIPIEFEFSPDTFEMVLPGLLCGGRVGHLGEDVVPEVVADQLGVLHVHLVHNQV